MVTLARSGNFQCSTSSHIDRIRVLSSLHLFKALNVKPDQIPKKNTFRYLGAVLFNNYPQQ